MTHDYQRRQVETTGTGYYQDSKPTSTQGWYCLQEEFVGGVGVRFGRSY